MDPLALHVHRDVVRTSLSLRLVPTSSLQESQCRSKPGLNFQEEGGCALTGTGSASRGAKFPANRALAHWHHDPRGPRRSESLARRGAGSAESESESPSH